MGQCRADAEPVMEVLWSDDNYAAVAKPAGLATIPGRAETDSVLEQLARQLGLPCGGEADPRLRVVHRLDKETSGVLLFAKNRAAQQGVSHQFQNNLVHKEYLALVVGRPAEREGSVDAPLAPSPKDPRRMAVSKRGRPARTDWRVEEQFRDCALVRCFPKTGKTHQIRVHLAHIGLPLAIDPLYGGQEGIYLSRFKRGYQRGGEAERPLIARLTLHAERLTFADLGGESVTITAELPKDYRAVLNMLRKHGR